MSKPVKPHTPPVGVFWRRVSADGRQYLSGRIENQRYVIFENQWKEQANQPDLIIYPAESSPAEPLA